jgi:hypothetical protein
VEPQLGAAATRKLLQRLWNLAEEEDALAVLEPVLRGPPGA